MAMALAFYACKDIPINVIHNHQEHFFNQLKRSRRAEQASKKLPWTVKGGDSKGSY